MISRKIKRQEDHTQLTVLENSASPQVMGTTQ